MSLPLLQQMAGRWAVFAFERSDPKVTLKVLQREVDELARAIEDGEYGDQCYECADVLISLLVLCSEIGCNLEQFTSHKLVSNMMRRWEKNPDGTWSHIEEGGVA
jgi:NTP pyrophosphatase (non-canonical NTP hydrolase)